ncbi:MAG: sigma-70 family RNA polymerase sigma factor [Acidobacteriota bacterium]|nr:sigma-70 family RNA polymerase sigma factor [Acidobacteriota bacterium]
MPVQENITQLLHEWSAGDDEALERLTPLVYGELRRLAASYLKAERADHTLQATALVHEAYLDLREMQHYSWQNRANFIGVMANLMRRILVEYARRHNAEKRGGENIKIPISEAEPSAASIKPNVDLIELDEVLQRFAAQFPRRAKIVELKFFGGLTINEIAEVLSEDGIDISTATIERDWRFARAWLKNELETV